MNTATFDQLDKPPPHDPASHMAKPRREFSKYHNICTVAIKVYDDDIGAVLGRFTIVFVRQTSFRFEVPYEALHAFNQCADVVMYLRNRPNRDWSINKFCDLLIDQFGFTEQECKK